MPMWLPTSMCSLYDLLPATNKLYCLESHIHSHSLYTTLKKIFLVWSCFQVVISKQKYYGWQPLEFFYQWHSCLWILLSSLVASRCNHIWHHHCSYPMNWLLITNIFILRKNNNITIDQIINRWKHLKLIYFLA